MFDRKFTLKAHFQVKAILTSEKNHDDDDDDDDDNDEKCFLFTLKALPILKIFKLLSCVF